MDPMPEPRCPDHEPAAAPAAAPSSEYASYMRTDELLALQRSDTQLLHRDERLFQCVHQATELWLKQANFEIEHATSLIEACQLVGAARILARASDCIDFITRPIDILTRMNPTDYRALRPALGQGSGVQSPGWQGLRAAAPRLHAAFTARRRAERMSLAEVFRCAGDAPLQLLAESLLDLDARVSLWRLRHLQVVVRTLGGQGVGTRGMPVQTLARLLEQRLFGELWEARAAQADSA